MFRLDRAILRETVAPAALCVLGLTFLFATVGLFQIVNRFEVTPRATTLLAFWPVLWKSLLPMTLPLSLMFATAMCFGRMRSDSELLVLSSAGVAPWRVFASLLPLCLLCGAASFYAASELGPEAYSRRFALSRQALADFVNHPPGGAHELRLNGLDISYADANDGRLFSLTLILHNDRGLLASLTAESARIRYDIDKLELVLVNVREPRLVCYDPFTGAPGSPSFDILGTTSQAFAALDKNNDKKLSPAELGDKREYLEYDRTRDGFLDEAEFAQAAGLKLQAMSASHIETLRWKFDFGSGEKAEGAKALDTSALLDLVAAEQNSKRPREASAELVRRAGLGFAGFLLPLLGALLAALVNHPNRLLAIAAGVIPGALIFFPLMTSASGLARSGLEINLAVVLAPLAALLACGVLLSRHVRGRWL